MEFLTMNSIDTLEKSNVDEDHDTLCQEVLEDVIEQRRHQEKGWRAKGIKCSRLTTTQNLWIGKIDEKYRTSKNSQEVVQ